MLSHKLWIYFIRKDMLYLKTRTVVQRKIHLTIVKIPRKIADQVLQNNMHERQIIITTNARNIWNISLLNTHAYSIHTCLIHRYDTLNAHWYTYIHMSNINLTFWRVTTSKFFSHVKIPWNKQFLCTTHYYYYLRFIISLWLHFYSSSN